MQAERQERRLPCSDRKVGDIRPSILSYYKKAMPVLRPAGDAAARHPRVVIQTDAIRDLASVTRTMKKRAPSLGR